MATCRRALAPITMERLPSHYPAHMYNAVARGMHRWTAVVRPPLPWAMRLANLPAAYVLRNFWGIPAHHPPKLLLQPIAPGWKGLVISLLAMVFTRVSSYIRQLNHSNEQVHSTTRRGLIIARIRFHPSMSCLPADFLEVCLAHNYEHDRFLSWCHHLVLEVHVPEHSLRADLLSCPMYLAEHSWQVNDVH